MKRMFIKKKVLRTQKGLPFSLIGSFSQLHDFEQVGVMSAIF